MAQDFRNTVKDVDRLVRLAIEADEGADHCETLAGLFLAVAAQLAARHRDKRLTSYETIMVNQALRAFKGGPPVGEIA